MCKEHEVSQLFSFFSYLKTVTQCHFLVEENKYLITKLVNTHLSPFMPLNKVFTECISFIINSKTHSTLIKSPM